MEDELPFTVPEKMKTTGEKKNMQLSLNKHF